MHASGHHNGVGVCVLLNARHASHQTTLDAFRQARLARSLSLLLSHCLLVQGWKTPIVCVPHRALSLSLSFSPSLKTPTLPSLLNASVFKVSADQTQRLPVHGARERRESERRETGERERRERGNRLRALGARNLTQRLPVQGWRGTQRTLVPSGSTQMRGSPPRPRVTPLRRPAHRTSEGTSER